MYFHLEHKFLISQLKYFQDVDKLWEICPAQATANLQLEQGSRLFEM